MVVFLFHSVLLIDLGLFLELGLHLVFFLAPLRSVCLFSVVPVVLLVLTSTPELFPVFVALALSALVVVAALLLLGPFLSSGNVATKLGDRLRGAWLSLHDAHFG
jgi:hypothetical protein